MAVYRKERLKNNPMYTACRFFRSIRLDPSGCWIWEKSKFSAGYGQFKSDGKNHKAHRFIYELLRAPIPAGLTIDHLCRVTSCVNPDHLDVVTMKENRDRRPRDKVCARGHERLPGTRRCKPCAVLRAKLYKQACKTQRQNNAKAIATNPHPVETGTVG